MLKFTSLQQIINASVLFECMCNDKYKLLLVNVCMPYVSDTVAVDEFSSVLADVAAITEQPLLRIIGGDFNVDFNKRYRRSGSTVECTCCIML